METSCESETRKKAMAALRRRISREQEGLGMSRHTFNVGLCMTMLLHLDAASCAIWICRQHRWLSVPPAERTPQELALQRKLEETIHASSPSVRASWTDPDMATLGKDVLRVATKAVRDKHLLLWVSTENATHGRAVSSQDVIRHWDAENTADTSAGARLINKGGKTRKAQTMWCVRWRRRCAAKIGYLRTKEPLQLQLKRDKVSIQNI